MVLSQRRTRRWLEFERLEERLLLAGDLLVSADDYLQEYQQTGARVSSIGIPQPPNQVNQQSKGLTVDSFGKVDVLIGNFDLYLDTYGPGTSSWSQQTFTGWSVVGRTIYGDAAAFQNYVFSNDMATGNYPDTLKGLIRFDMSGGPTVRFADSQDFVDVTMGLDGLLYGNTGQSVYVYDPVTLALVRTINFSSLVYDVPSVAVDAAGNIIAAEYGGTVVKIDPTGTQILASLNLTSGPHGTGESLCHLALDSDGQVAIGDTLGTVFLTNESLASYSFFDVIPYTIYPPVVFVTFNHYIPANVPVRNPIPAISGLSQSSAAEGSEDFVLTLNGTGFTSSSAVQWNGQALTTSFLSATQLQATVPSADSAEEGSVSANNITVFNPAPGGGTSNSVPFSITDAGLTATGATVIASSTVSFSGQVATINDANATAPLTDFTSGAGGVSIDWGDGTAASTGTVTQSGGIGTAFIVTGTHTYSLNGPFTIHVTITDAGSSTTIATARAYVSSPHLPPSGIPVNAMQDVSFSGLVASFIDTDPNAPLTDFTTGNSGAMIDWGDGSQATVGMVSQPGGTGTIFLVNGSHLYAEEGVYPITANIVDLDGDSAITPTTGIVVDAPLTATGVAVQAPEGALFSGQVASFTDTEPNAPLADFRTGGGATIDWGDGSGSLSGTVSQPGGAGTAFVISGSHTYQEEGSYAISVIINDVEGGTAHASSTATIIDAGLTPSGHPVIATEGISFSGQVAGFTDANPNAPLSDFAGGISRGTIDWGDGSPPSSGTVSQSGGVGTAFIVQGSHTYLDEMNHTVVVTITDAGGSTAQTTTTATIRDASLTAGSTAINATERSSFSGPVATFTDGNATAPLSDFTSGGGGATINWGDGSPASSGMVSQPSGTGSSFVVSGSHTYAEEGNYTVSVTIHDAGGGSTQTTATATIGDAMLTPNGTPVSATEGALFSGQVATFADANANAPLSDFTMGIGKAMIDWGDGSAATTGTVTQPGGVGTAFVVKGSHTYADQGSHTVTVSITDAGGSTAPATSTATISDAGLTPSGTPVIATEGISFSGQVASFTDANPTAPLSDFVGGTGAASIDWGDGSTASSGAVSQPGAQGTWFIVSGTHIYSDEGSHTIRVTVADAGGSTAQISSTVMIGDASLTASRIPVKAADGVAFTGSVASFVDANAKAPLSDFTTGTGGATIDWGDGSPTSPGTITQPGGPGTAFFVAGSHTYTDNTSHTIVVSITDAGGSITSVTTTRNRVIFRDDLVGRVGENGQWWAGQSNGSAFTTSLVGSWNPAATWVDVVTGDFNGDGRMDVAGRVLQTGQWWVSLSTGSSFTTSLWTTWNPAVTWSDVRVGDFNGDSEDDIVGRVQQNGQWWLASSTGSTFVNQLWGAWNPAVTWVEVNVGDFNGDGKADLTARFLQGGSWWTALSTGSSFATSLWATWNPAVTWVDVNVGDFNGDGKADIVGRWLQGGSWYAGISSGSSFSTALWGAWNPSVTWVDVRVGDFTGDGKDDIIGRWSQSGQWWVAMSSGSSFQNSLWGAWNPAATWVDLRVGDFNHDGKTDILGRWLEGGQWFVGISTGTSLTTSLWASWSPAVTWVDVQTGHL